MSRPQVVERVRAFMENPQAGSFQDLALEAFHYQFEHNQPYRLYCSARGRGPSEVRSWSDIPPVPVSAFKHSPLTTGPAKHVFRTSGTTGWGRGEHHLPHLDLYRESWREPFRRALVPDGRRLPILSFIPEEAELPDSSLSWMTARAMETFGDPASRTVLRHGELDADGLAAFYGEAKSPALVLGTGFALAAALEAGKAGPLPRGTRLMDTGGFKGRRRDLSREHLLTRYRKQWGIPREMVVGEYGMTELCSQWYEDPVTGCFTGPPWVRVQALDPVSLAPVAPGRPGLLAFWDLANAWTVSAVVTEDVGILEGAGFRLTGRASGAELRGCSLSVEELRHE